MSNQGECEVEDADSDRDHLEGVECGAGCTEIWEHLEQRRREQADED